MVYLCINDFHPQQGAEATSAGSATHEGGIFGDATPPPSETINIDDPPSDPNFSQDTGTGSEEVCMHMCVLTLQMYIKLC